MTEDPAQPPPPRSNPKPRLSVQWRIVVWVMAVAAVPLALLIGLQASLDKQASQRGPVEEVELVSRVLAAGLNGRIDAGYSSRAQGVIDAAAQDMRLSLIVVTDADHNTLLSHTASPLPDPALDIAQLDLNAFALDIGRSRTLGQTKPHIACMSPIWTTGRAAKRELSGYVFIAMDASGQGQSGPILHTQIVIAAAALAIIFPAVWFAARRTAKPLARIVAATHALAHGKQASPVPAHQRDEIGLLGEAFNDMANRLRVAHDQLKQHNENLNDLIAERTVELEEANAKLAEQIADKDAFLRSVSHDLSAPLRNIDGMANMVLRKHRETLDDDVIRKLERICANVKQETELINELVELNRLREDKPKKSLVDLNELVAEIFAGLSHETEQAQIETRIAGTLPTLRAERTRIRQVFQNLIDNAAKYMMDAPVRTITVRFDQDLEFYRFCVEDTGRGIAWEDQPKVFQVFNRATHSGTHHVQGKGVGLASVKSIVEGYGGQIWVDSELGKGSTFTFTLQRERVSPAVEAAQAS